jgi:hypothetical protein
MAHFPVDEDFWTLISYPPQQAMECNAVNKYTWTGSSQDDQDRCYKAMWRLLDKGGANNEKGINQQFFDVLRVRVRRRATM